MRKISILVLILFLCTLCSCTNKTTINNDDLIKLSFKDALSYSYLKSIANKTVEINGYMATSSPVDGSFIFLMNLPYQSCPFCKPNTQTLSNTIEVYPKSGSTFKYNESAIKVIGTLIVSESEDVSFTDQYGYEFNFKIDNARYEIIDESTLSSEVLLWNKVAESNIINDIYDMLDYVNFVVKWPTYFVNSYETIDGDIVPGYYLYASDAEHYIKEDNAQYNYGYKDGYFDALINRCNKLDESKLDGLISIIERSEALADLGVKALNNKEYTYEYKYVAKFGTNDYIYKLNDETSLYQSLETLLDDFNLWFTSWLTDMEM